MQFHIQIVYGVFFRGKAVGAGSYHPHLLPRLKMNGAMPLSLLHVLISSAGTALPLHYTVKLVKLTLLRNLPYFNVYAFIYILIWVYLSLFKL